MSVSRSDGPEAMSPSSVEAEEPAEPWARRATLERALRWIGGIAMLLLVVGSLAHWLRPELETIGHAFVERFGLFGMMLGAFLADGFHFPVPPQFYMLMAIVANSAPLPALSAITFGSLLGGTVGFFFARRLARFRLVAKWLARSSRIVQRFGTNHGYRLIVAASLTPIAYSALCYLAGFYRLPKRLYALLALLRVPKLVLYYYLVQLGWGFG
jgi:membrane protein YqaA with SNARE-associated domain